MRVLITGGAGFIGSHLADALIQAENQVWIIDDLRTGRRDNIPAEAKFFPLSICDFSEFDQVFAALKPEIVIHAAASYKNPDKWHDDINVNCNGTANVCILSKKYAVNRLVYFQTSLCYGLNPPEKPISVKCPIAPKGTTYAITKTAGEQIVQMSGLDWISFRLANVIGDRNISGPVATFYNRLSAGKACFIMDTRRDFIFVKDLVRLVMRAVGGEGKSGVYHISTGGDYAIADLYHGICKAMGIEAPEAKHVPRGPDDAETLLIDPAGTEREFPGWKADTPLDQTLADAVAWYKTHDVAETYTHLKMSR